MELYQPYTFFALITNRITPNTSNRITLQRDFHSKQVHKYTFFDVLLTVHLSIFISVINQLDAQNFCFTISLFHVSTCLEHMCSKHVETWNKLIVKQKFCASSWLITEINILRCTYWDARSAKRQKMYTCVLVYCGSPFAMWFDLMCSE